MSAETAWSDSIDERIGEISEGVEGLIKERDFWQDEAQRLANALTEIAGLNAYSMGRAMGIATAALRGDAS